MDYTYSSAMTDAQGLSYWYEEKGDKIADAVFQSIKFLDTYQGYRAIDNLRNMRLYGNLRVLGLSAGMYARTESQDTRKNRVCINIVQSMCDTVTNKIAKNKPKVSFLTYDGDAKLQRKAKKLEQFIQGQFYSTNIYDIMPSIFLDSTVFDLGCLHVFSENGKIKVERVFPGEIRVDDMEAVYGTPQVMHREKDIPREQVYRMFPEAKFAQAIRDAKQTTTGISGQYVADMIRVVESWKLASGQTDKDGKPISDGKHTITIEGKTLLEEGYNRTTFPFIFMKWSERLRGFYGQSLAERLTGKQLEVNKILRVIQLSSHLLSMPKVLMDIGSDIVEAHINNEVGGIWKYSGNPPQVITPQAIPQDLFNHLKYIIQSAYEEAGISMLSAQSKKPEGLDSGKALREFNDIESERFMLTGQNYEQAFLDVAKLMIMEAKDLYEKNGNLSVLTKGKKFIESIDWGEVDLEEDQYMMQVFPTTFLSSTPSGRLSDVTDLVKAGFIDKDNAMRLLDFPDLEAYVSMATAAIEDIDLTIEAILDKGVYIPPEPFQNLDLGIKRFQSAYLRAKINKVPEEKLGLLRDWMDQAQTMLNPPPPDNGMPDQTGAEAAAPEGPVGLEPSGNAPLLAKPEALQPSPLVPQAPMPQ